MSVWSESSRKGIFLLGFSFSNVAFMALPCFSPCLLDRFLRGALELVHSTHAVDPAGPARAESSRRAAMSRLRNTSSAAPISCTQRVRCLRQFAGLRGSSQHSAVAAFSVLATPKSKTKSTAGRTVRDTQLRVTSVTRSGSGSGTTRAPSSWISCTSVRKIGGLCGWKFC